MARRPGIENCRNPVLGHQLPNPYLTLRWLWAEDATPDVGTRAASTVVLVCFAGGFIFMAGSAIRARDELREWARADQPDENLAEQAIVDGPADAVAERVSRAVARAVLRLPLGWFAIALVPTALAVVLLAGIRNTWTTGFPLSVEPAGAESTAAYALDVYEHLATYVFWGGILVVTLVEGFLDMVPPRKVAQVPSASPPSLRFCSASMWPRSVCGRAVREYAGGLCRPPNDHPSGDFRPNWRLVGRSRTAAGVDGQQRPCLSPWKSPLAAGGSLTGAGGFDVPHSAHDDARRRESTRSRFV